MWSGDGVDGVDVEEVVALGLDVAVEHDVVAASSIDVPRQNTGYDWPSMVRVTYHHGPWRTGTDWSVSWTRDLISLEELLDELAVLRRTTPPA